MALIKLPGDGPLVDTWCPWKHLYSTSVFFSLVLATRARVCPSRSTSLNPMLQRAAGGGQKVGQSWEIHCTLSKSWGGVNVWIRKGKPLVFKYLKTLLKIKLTFHLPTKCQWIPFSCDRMENPRDHQMAHPLPSTHACKGISWHSGTRLSLVRGGQG